LLHKNPRDRIHDFAVLKSADWLADVEWDQILLKNKLSPLFMPTPSKSLYQNISEYEPFSFEKDKPFKEVYNKFYFVSREFEEIAGINSSNVLTESKNRNSSAFSAKTTAFMMEKNLISLQKPKSARKPEVKQGENSLKKINAPLHLQKTKILVQNFVISTNCSTNTNSNPSFQTKNNNNSINKKFNGLSYRGAVPKTFSEIKRQLNLKDKKENSLFKNNAKIERKIEGNRGEIRENQGKREISGEKIAWKEGLEGEDFLFRTK
jgi:hypothetical protein